MIWSKTCFLSAQRYKTTQAAQGRFPKGRISLQLPRSLIPRKAAALRQPYLCSQQVPAVPVSPAGGDIPGYMTQHNTTCCQTDPEPPMGCCIPSPSSAAGSCIARTNPCAANARCLTMEGDGSNWRQSRLLSPGSGFPRWLDAASAAGCGPCHRLPHPWSSSSLRCARPADAGGERRQEARSLGFLRIYHGPRQPRKGTEQQTHLAALHPLPLCYETPKTTGSVSRGGLETQRSSSHKHTCRLRQSLSFCSSLVFCLFFLADKIHFWDCLL